MLILRQVPIEGMLETQGTSSGVYKMQPAKFHASSESRPPILAYDRTSIWVRHGIPTIRIPVVCLNTESDVFSAPPQT